jgi:hypothetical protein
MKTYNDPVKVGIDDMVAYVPKIYLPIESLAEHAQKVAVPPDVTPGYIKQRRLRFYDQVPGGRIWFGGFVHL